MLPISFYLSLVDNEADRSKVEQLYHTYKNQMLFVTRSILKNEDDAEDAVHDAFVRIATNIELVRTDEPSETRRLIVIMAKHAALRFIENEPKEVTFTEKDIPENIFPDPIDYQNEITNDELIAKTKEDINKLNTYYATPLCLKIDGYKYSEIAAFLNITEENAKILVYRARKMLKNYWRE